MEIFQELSNNIGQSLQNLQENFIHSNFGKTINAALDKGLKKLLPDSIEDEVLDIKNAFIEEGFSEGINTAIDKALETGRNVLKIFKGDFSSIEELGNILQEGNLQEKISDLLDFTLNKLEDNGIIGNETLNIIKIGKEILLNATEISIDENVTGQIQALQNLEKNIEKWNIAYENQDFDKMETAYNKIEKDYKEIMPLELIMTKVNVIDNLQNLIKNNGEKFNLTEEQKALAGILCY